LAHLRFPDGALRALYRRLLAMHGRQHWWPADTAFEVMVGAVLTQNAAWSNVEQAIARLKSQDLLALDALLASPREAVADAIRPSGYFNVKTKRLLHLCRFLAGAGGLDAFARQPLARQREALLGVHGIGPETADDILLYAFDRPVFVIDAYTRRLLARVGLAAGNEDYESLRAACEDALGPDVDRYKELHALIVVHAKHHCRKSPACAGCNLQTSCDYYLR
jgi:endonuclease-3 related protein